eukprot:jgi/Ulvmu1/3368/UM156_0025.1
MTGALTFILHAIVLVSAGLLVCANTSRSLLSEADHRYKRGEKVKIYANKVGPFHNPSETYQYYILPFCEPETKEYRSEGLGQVLAGDRTVNSLYELTFGEDRPKEDLCTKTLTSEHVSKFRNAVANEYYFQMFFDDLPIWGFVGKMEKNSFRNNLLQYFLFTHFHFEVRYNGDRIIGINTSADPQRTVEITEDAELNVEFSYSVKWVETQTPFEKRMDKYREQSFLPQHLEIHWFSIINSSVLVLLLLVILVTIFTRVLKHDFAKFSRDEELGDEAEETGWKYIHGDVFRLPKRINLLCAIIGSGFQILVLTLAVFLLVMLGGYSPTNRGAIIASSILLYAFTASIAGYVSGYYYKMFGGAHWNRNVLLTASLFSGPMVATFAVLNTIAIIYRSTQALPFGTIVLIIFLWALVTFPLTVLGGIMAKNAKVSFDPPCRTTKYPREIPALPWYRKTIPQMLFAGFLPFSAIYIELHYIFASVWGHKDFTIFSILFVVFGILLIVTATITVVLTYFQLAVEDHHWWWRSMLCGGATGIFVFAYCFYYHFARSGFTSFMQVSRYYGYMAMVCYALFLILASVGFVSSMAFVRLIYRSIKSD